MGLLDALIGNKPLGSGMAQNAHNNISGRAYQLYAQEAKASGQTPLTREQWEKMQRGG